MSIAKIEVVPDPSVSTGGHAIIKLRGISILPPGATLRIDPIDESLADDVGWPRGNITPLATRQTPDGLELSVGPDVVDAPLLEPGVPVTITVSDADVSAELVWPNLPVSTTATVSAPVVMTASQMAAEYAAAERSKAEAKRAASEAAAQRERERSAAAEVAKRDAAVAAAIAAAVAGPTTQVSATPVSTTQALATQALATPALATPALATPADGTTKSNGAVIEAATISAPSVTLFETLGELDYVLANHVMAKVEVATPADAVMRPETSRGKPPGALATPRPSGNGATSPDHDEPLATLKRPTGPNRAGPSPEATARNTVVAPTAKSSVAVAPSPQTIVNGKAASDTLSRLEPKPSQGAGRQNLASLDVAARDAARGVVVPAHVAAQVAAHAPPTPVSHVGPQSTRSVGRLAPTEPVMSAASISPLVEPPADTTLPSIVVKQASAVAARNATAAALSGEPLRSVPATGLLAFFGGAALAAASLLLAVFAAPMLGIGPQPPPPAPRPVIADAFMAGPQSPRGEIATNIDLPTALRLADHNLHGVDRPIDRGEAEFWLKKAMALTASHTQLRWALTQLGALAAQPVSGEPDYEKARLLWEISAGNGDPVALCFLGTLAENGLGAPANRIQALQYYKRSKELGGCPSTDEAIARLSKS